MQASNDVKKECEEKIAKINAIVDSIQGAIAQHENAMTTKWALSCQHSSMEKECENKIASINSIIGNIQAAMAHNNKVDDQHLVSDKIEVAGAFNKDGTPFKIFINNHESDQKAREAAAFVQKWLDEHKPV